MNSTAHATLLAAAFALLSGCGGSSSTQSEQLPADAQLLIDQRVTGFPHAIDIYVPANPVRVVVFLHGGLGTKERQAYNMGITFTSDVPTSSSVNWTWLNARGVVAVVPQGQTLPEAPFATTWSNHVMVSGQDDVAFLQALAAKMRADYGNVPISLVGHSNGGMMANRMWCESPQTFDVHVALAGPSSVFYLNPDSPCAPSTIKPYLGFVGDQDTRLEGSEHWTQAQWKINDNPQAVINADLIGEWAQFVSRAGSVCGETPNVNAGAVSGNITTWEACGGRLRVQRGAGLDHGLGAPSISNPTVLSDRAVDFIVGHETR